MQKARGVQSQTHLIHCSFLGLLFPSQQLRCLDRHCLPKTSLIAEKHWARCDSYEQHVQHETRSNKVSTCRPTGLKNSPHVQPDKAEKCNTARRLENISRQKLWDLFHDFLLFVLHFFFFFYTYLFCQTRHIANRRELTSPKWRSPCRTKTNLP